MGRDIKIFLLLLVILALIVAGCGGGGDKKKKEEQDKANQDALKRNASVVANETQTFNLSVCSGTITCATDGTGCNTTKPATQPGVCATGPILTCICPEKTVCLMVQNSTSQNPNTNASNNTYVGNCKS